MDHQGTGQQPAQGDDLAAHLQMVQAVVFRMGQNAFEVKTWAVTLMAAVFVLTPSDGASRWGLWLVLIPAIIFWVLDAYYFRRERLFRELYDAVRAGGVPAFAMDTALFEPRVPSSARLMVARNILAVHLITVASIGLKAAAVSGCLRVR